MKPLQQPDQNTPQLFDILWARPRDLTALKSAVHRSLSGEALDAIQQKMSKNTCSAVLAILDGTIIGYTIYEHYTRKIIIHAVSVIPTKRRLNIAKAMLLKIYTAVIDTQTHITCTVPDSNLPAHCLLRSVGFKAIKVVNDSYCFSLSTEIIKELI